MVSLILSDSTIYLIFFSGAKESTGDASQSTETLVSDNPGESTHDDIDETPKLRKPRLGRRYQAKSEPATQLRDSMDGLHESEMNGFSSSEGQPLLDSQVHDVSNESRLL